jgi:hypothetical protein
MSPRAIRASAEQRRRDQMQQTRFLYTAALQQVYRNNRYGFSLRYPKGWKMQNVMQEGAGTLKTIILFVSPLEAEKDEAQENINLLVEELSAPRLTLEEYTAAALENERDIFTDYTLLASHSLLIDGMPAHRVAFTGSLDGETTVAFEQIWLLREGRAFVWSLASSPASLDRYAQMFRQMIGSVDFVD